MFMQKINIREKLDREKQKDSTPDHILKEVYEILLQADASEERIAENMAGKTGSAGNPFDFELLEGSRIYHVKHIRHIAINYRLRFLDSRYFKGKIPPEALAKIKGLEEQHRIEIKGFKV